MIDETVLAALAYGVASALIVALAYVATGGGPTLTRVWIFWSVVVAVAVGIGVLRDDLLQLPRERWLQVRWALIGGFVLVMLPLGIWRVRREHRRQ